MTIVLISILFASTIIVPQIYFRAGGRGAGRGKRALFFNLISFAAVFVFSSVFIFSGKAFAAEQAAAVSDTATAAAYLAAAIVTGLACIGTGVAVGPAATAAIGAISENEGIMSKALVFVAMAEGIAIYGLLISFMILNNV
ncbi:MAG: ATP synthase subunit C [Defluviitaleaceae bacterium]|nr:ATP synthase subunit C [Defluviitaleaceae bacterium]